MRKTFYILLLACLAIVLAGSCGKPKKDMRSLQHIVEQVNAKGETQLANGTVLTKCEYALGDSVLTYYIKVNDNRFDRADADSIKSALVADFARPEKAKLTTLLIRNGIGVRYVFNTSSKEIAIVLSPDELKGKAQ